MNMGEQCVSRKKILAFMSGGIALVGLLAILFGTKAHALELTDEEERPGAYQLMYLNADTFLYERDDEASTVLRELKKQELVVPIEIGVPWMRVSIGDLTGYVKSEYLQMENPDPLAVQEFKEQEAYHTELINEIDRLTKEQKRSRMYGIIVICIIVGIFAAGIVSTVMRRKQEGHEEVLRKRADERDSLKSKNM